jgi:N-acetylmuramoyl-L-alanine amidase
MRWISLPLAACLLLGMAAPAPEEKRISIYSPAADYSLSVSEREGNDYVGLLEILEPLGGVTAKMQGQKWQLRFNDIEAQFTPGSNKARIRGRDVDLPARFLLENHRGLVPLDSLVTLLPNFLGIPVMFHNTARRLFISEAGTTYKAELKKTTPAKLVLNFSSPVNPNIGTEPGKLNMVFLRDPLVLSGPETINFNDEAISSATVKENNGAVEFTVNSALPLLASFSNDGRTITIAPVPSPAPPATASVAAAPETATSPAPLTGPALSAHPSSVPAAAPRYFAVVDASHGGDERGAALGDNLAEKDVSLAFAQHIRQELGSRGLATLMLRDSDSTLTLDQRAANANSAHPALYITVHAATEGVGVRVYTALLPPAGESRGPFMAWDAAQAPFLSASRAVASKVAGELGKKIAVRLLAAPLRPLNNLTSAAIAIEVAPQTGDLADLTSSNYQQLVATSIAAALATVREQLESSQ